MPLPSTRQSQMAVHQGHAPSVDDDFAIPSISFMQNVVAKVDDYTLKAVESGTVFTTEGASKDLEFTLPAVSGLDGVVFWIINAEDYELLVTAPNETLVAFNDATADGISYTTASNHIGCGFMFVCDGTLWYACCFRGDSGATITVISA